MRKFLPLLIALAMLIALMPSGVSAADTPISVVLDGEKLKFTVNPVSVKGVVMVPMKPIFETLGAQIKYDSKTKTITAVWDDIKITHKVGTKKAVVDGKNITLSGASTFIKGVTMVPYTFLADSLGASVSWDKAKNTVVIKSPVKKFRLTTQAFKSGGSIPDKYTLYGDNVSISLSFVNVPEGTKSFALLMYDLHPIADEWIHWAVINIPGDTKEITENASNSSNMPIGSYELNNDYGEVGYGGPQPPPQTGKHQYKTIVYALNIEVVEGLYPQTAVEDFEAALKDYVAAKAEISGYYEK